MQRKVSKELALVATEESSKDEVTGLRRHFEVHKISGNVRTNDETVSWERSPILLKKRATKSVDQDMRNMMNARVN